MLYLFRRKIFSTKSFFRKYDFFENTFWCLTRTKKYQQRKITGDEIPSLTCRIPVMESEIRPKWPEFGIAPGSSEYGDGVRTSPDFDKNFQISAPTGA
jgi:hypothetical protein